MLATHPDLIPIEDAASQVGASVSFMIAAAYERIVRLHAPVLSEGLYEWPPKRSWLKAHVPELNSIRITQEFSVCDRVIVGRVGIAQLQSHGSTHINRFSAPDRVRKILIDVESFRGQSVLDAAYGRTESGETSLANMYHISSAATEYSMLALQLPWRLSRLSVNQPPKTRVRHLLVQATDLVNLTLWREERRSRVVHGNTEFHAAQREEVLAAAVHLLSKEPAKYPTAQQLATGVFQFWPGAPPMSTGAMAELLSMALKRGAVLRRNNKNSI